MNDTWGYKSYDHNWKSTATPHPQPGGHRQQRRQLPAQRRPHLRGPHPGSLRRAAQGDRPMDEGQRRGHLRHHRQPLQTPALGPLHQEAHPGRHDPLPARLQLAGGRQAARPRPQEHRPASLPADRSGEEGARHAEQRGRADPHRARRRARSRFFHHRPGGQRPARHRTARPGSGLRRLGRAARQRGPPARQRHQIRDRPSARQPRLLDQPRRLGRLGVPGHHGPASSRSPPKSPALEKASLEVSVGDSKHQRRAARHRRLRQVQGREAWHHRDRLARQGDPRRPARQRRLAPAQFESDPPEAGDALSKAPAWACASPPDSCGSAPPRGVHRARRAAPCSDPARCRPQQTPRECWSSGCCQR